LSFSFALAFTRLLFYFLIFFFPSCQ